MRLNEMIKRLENLRTVYGGELRCVIWNESNDDELTELVEVEYDVFEINPDATKYVLFLKPGDPGV